MNILIPVNNNNIDDAQITVLDDLKYWLFLDITEGKVRTSEFYQSKEEISELIDIVILKSDKEDVWQFMEESIAVLLAPFQNSIDDIVEAYLFKELHDMTI